LIEKIYVEEGQKVYKGQLLFKINQEEAKLHLDRNTAALQSAKAQVRIAEVELKRIAALVDKQIVSVSEQELADAKLDAAKASVAEAIAAQNEARTLLSYTSVVAPFDGVIDRIPLRQGSLVTKGSLLTTISDLQSVYAYFDVPEQEYISLLQEARGTSVSGKVQLTLADGSLYPLYGDIKSAESEIDGSTGSIAFRAIFSNPDRLLKHGATGTLHINKPVDDVLLVPQKSVFEIQDKSYVYVLEKDNTVKMKNFEPAERIGSYYIVASGLSAQDRIVFEGAQSLRDGVTIKPVAAKL